MSDAKEPSMAERWNAFVERLNANIEAGKKSQALGDTRVSHEQMSEPMTDFSRVDLIKVLHEAAKRSGASKRLSLHDLKTMADAVVAALSKDRP